MGRVGACFASLVLFAWAWGPAFPAEVALAEVGSLIGGQGSGDSVALVSLRASELTRLALAVVALALWARQPEAEEKSPSSLPTLVAALLAATWADAVWGGWPPPQGIAPPIKVLASTALAVALAQAFARLDARGGWGVVLLLLGGLGQQLARPAVELESLRSLERLILGDLTRSLVPLGISLSLVLIAAWTRGPLRQSAAASALALTAGGLWGLALLAFRGPCRGVGFLLPLALGAEALSAQIAGWGRLAPGIPGTLLAGAAWVAAALLGLGRESVDPADGGRSRSQGA